MRTSVMQLFFSQRLLSVLQLTRMALVFTAVPNTLCSLALLAKYQERATGNSLDQFIVWDQWLAIALMSLGLYSFGMSLNDIVDRRRDQQLEDKRPTLTLAHWWAMFCGLGLADFVCIMSVWWRRQHHFAHGTFTQSLWVHEGLIYPGIAAIIFVLFAIWLRRRISDPRAAG